MENTISIQLKNFMKENDLTKTEMAEKLKISRAALNRYLYSENKAITLKTLKRIAAAMNKKIKLEFI